MYCNSMPGAGGWIVAVRNLNSISLSRACLPPGNCRKQVNTGREERKQSKCKQTLDAVSRKVSKSRYKSSVDWGGKLDILKEKQ